MSFENVYFSANPHTVLRQIDWRQTEPFRSKQALEAPSDHLCNIVIQSLWFRFSVDSFFPHRIRRQLQAKDLITDG